MAKKTFDFEIEEIHECIKESKNSTWGKYIATISFDNKPADINIRNIDIPNNRLSSGITLTPDEREETTNTFIKMGYGSTSIMKEEIYKRESRTRGFSFTSPTVNTDDTIYIDFN